MPSIKVSILSFQCFCNHHHSSWQTMNALIQLKQYQQRFFWSVTLWISDWTAAEWWRVIRRIDGAADVMQTNLNCHLCCCSGWNNDLNNWSYWIMARYFILCFLLIKFSQSILDKTPFFNFCLHWLPQWFCAGLHDSHSLYSAKSCIRANIIISRYNLWQGCHLDANELMVKYIKYEANYKVF